MHRWSKPIKFRMASDSYSLSAAEKWKPIQEDMPWKRLWKGKAHWEQELKPVLINKTCRRSHLFYLLSNIKKFKARLDGAWATWDSGKCLCSWQGVGLEEIEGLLQHKPFQDSGIKQELQLLLEMGDNKRSPGLYLDRFRLWVFSSPQQEGLYNTSCSILCNSTDFTEQATKYPKWEFWSFHEGFEQPAAGEAEIICKYSACEGF